MFSKALRTGLFLLLGLSVGFSVGCSYVPWGEQPAREESAPIQLGSETRCLKDAVTKVKNFVEGQAQVGEVVSLFDCLEGALELFQKRVRGENPDRYTARELKGFFEQYLLNEGSTVPEDLLTELMALKVLLVGGNELDFTRSEFRELQSLVRESGRWSLEILPAMPVLSRLWSTSEGTQPPLDESEISAAHDRLRRVTLLLARRFSGRGASYSLQRVVPLLKSFESYFEVENPKAGAVAEWMPFVSQLKQSLLGSSPMLIEPPDWMSVAQWISRSSVLALRIQLLKQQGSQDWSTHDLMPFIGDLVDLAEESLSGKERQALTIEELHRLGQAVPASLEAYRYQANLFPALLSLKRSLMGGDRVSITTEDLERLKSHLPALRQLAKFLFEYEAEVSLEPVDPQLSRDLARDRQKRMAAELTLLATPLGSLLLEEYDLNELRGLMEGLAQSFPQAASIQWGRELVDLHFSTVILAKALLLGQSENPQLRVGDWRRLMQAATVVFPRVTFLQSLIRGQNWKRMPVLSDLDLWLHDLDSGLSLLLELRGEGPEKGFSTDEILAVLLKLQEHELLSKDISSATLRQVTQRFLSRFLTEPEARLRGVAEQGVGSTALRVGFTELFHWVEGQKSLDQLLNQKPLWPWSDWRRILKDLAGSSVVTELLRVFDVEGTLGADEQGRVLLVHGQALPLDERTLTQINFARAAVRWTFRSYAGDFNRALSLDFLLEPEFEQMFLDFRPLAIEAGLLDPKNTRFPKNRFLEANLFTAWSDGNQEMSFSEANWLVGLIVSGLAINNNLKAAYGPCGSPAEVTCALQAFLGKLPTEFSTLANSRDYLLGLSQGEQREILRNLLMSVGWKDSERRVLLSDLNLLPHVLQYIESLMLRYDRDGNGVLDLSEALVGEALFAPLLKRFSGFDDPQWVRALYAYILVYGKAPDNFADEIFFASDWVNRESWPVRADRRKFAQILGYISGRVRKSTAP